MPGSSGFRPTSVMTWPRCRAEFRANGAIALTGTFNSTPYHRGGRRRQPYPTVARMGRREIRDAGPEWRPPFASRPVSGRLRERRSTRAGLCLLGLQPLRRLFDTDDEAVVLAVRHRFDAVARGEIEGDRVAVNAAQRDGDLMLYSDDDSGLLKPTPLTEVRYADDVDPSAPQRIWVCHTTVALGYWQRPEAQADGFRDGWFSPGDMFLRTADGRLEFTGRNDDMLKIAGQWVSTLWVEQALAAACGETIQQIAAVGVTTADGLTALAALAVAAPGRDAEARRRIADGIAAMPGHRRPRWVHWLNTLPLTATGKLQRGRLRALHESALAPG